jgi:FtsH-binding integral membrane protein
MNFERLKRTVNPYFFAVILFITLNYVVFVFEYAIGRNPKGQLIILAVFHLLFVMLLWSMFTVILSDPGKVPIYWGFFAE